MSVPRIAVRMRARDVDERHRVSSPLELLFDLTFVAAISTAAGQFAARVEHGQLMDGLVPFVFVFFAIWWAWMNFTWFASAYDTDDVPYRLLTVVQMAGVLVIAAGVEAAFHEFDLRVTTLGYLIMRIGLVGQWLRASVQHPETRGTTLRYAIGISAVWCVWAVLTVVPYAAWVPFALIGCALLEWSVPIWAERRVRTSWHPHHIAERYGLFTIILLGEGVLGATVAVQHAVEAEGGLPPGLIAIGAAALLITVGLWWIYFLLPIGEGLQQHRGLAFFWGYGHYVVFAALAGVGAGVEVAVASTESSGEHVDPQLVVGMTAVPVALAVLAIGALTGPLIRPAVLRPLPLAIAVALIALAPLATPLLGVGGCLLGAAAVLAGLIAATTFTSVRRAAELA